MILNRAKIYITVFALSLLCILPNKTYAQENNSGSITITELNSDDSHEPIAGIQLSLYQIAVGNRLEGTASVLSEFKDAYEKGVFTFDADKLSNGDTAKALTEYVKSNGISEMRKAVTDLSGRIVFSDLTDGIYVIVQTNSEEDFKSMGYTANTSPYIVELPSVDENGDTIRRISCKPKCEVITYPEPSVISLKVYKVWKDDNDSAKARPTEITVGLYDGKELKDKVKLTALNNWFYEWNSLSSDGNWVVDEINVPEGYSKSVEGDTTKYTITNTYKKPETPTPGGPKPGTPPKTGDESPIEVYALLMIASAVILILLLFIQKKRKVKK